MSGPDRFLIIDTRGERRTVAQGMTTDAPSGLPAFKSPLKEMMCIVMCACKKLFEDNQKVPEITTDGTAPGPDAAAAVPETEESATSKPRKLQQNCVATLFQTLDRAAEYKSWVKAEVSFDMDGYRFGFKNIGDKIPRRPQPLMSQSLPTKPLKWHWGVMGHVGRRKKTTLSQPTFTRGGQSLRRPDIVVVRNPAIAPIESNIAMIYEMKFNERVEERQLEAYVEIVNGDTSRVDAIEVKDCRCEKRNERLREVTRDELVAWAAVISSALAAAAASGGRHPPDLQPAHVSTGLSLVAAIVFGAVAVAALPAEVLAAIAAFCALMLGLGTAAAR